MILWTEIDGGMAADDLSPRESRTIKGELICGYKKLMQDVAVFSVFHRVRFPLMYRHKSSLNHVIKDAASCGINFARRGRAIVAVFVPSTDASVAGQQAGSRGSALRVCGPALSGSTGSVPGHIRRRGPLPVGRA